MWMYLNAIRAELLEYELKVKLLVTLAPPELSKRAG